jgi:integrase
MTQELDAEVARLRSLDQQEAERSKAAMLLGIDLDSTTSSPDSKRPPTLRDFYKDRVVPHIQALYSAAALQKAVAPWAYLLYRLGDLRLDQITTQVIHKYEEEMTLPGAARCFRVRRDGRARKPRTDKLSNGSVNKHVQHLMAALRFAGDEGVLTTVPRARLLPLDDTQEVLPPTDEEFEILLRTCEDFREDAAFLPEVVKFAAETGMREGEIMNLTWGQVEAMLGGRGAVRIERRTKGRSRAGKPYRPKHGRFRVVPLSTGARAVLATMRKNVPTGPSDKIFPNRGGTPYVRIEYDPDVKGTGYFPIAVEAAGMKGHVTFHGLRHYFAVRCLARGIPMSVVSDYLGHTSIELTVKLYGRFGDDARARWKWIELLDEPVDAIARRRMLTVLEGERSRSGVDEMLAPHFQKGGAAPGVEG